MSLVIQCNMPDIGLGADFFSSVNCAVKNYICTDTFVPEFPENLNLVIFHYQNDNPCYLNTINNIQNLKPEIPIILTSTHRDEKITLWALRSRIWDLVKLPHELPLLKDSIRKILTRHKLINRQEDTISNVEVNMCRKTKIAKEYIDKHFSNKIRVEELASLSHMSPTTFLRYFKKENGITVREYIKLKRITHARQLLESSFISIKEVALSSGYSDISLFNRIFKGLIGLTPSEFRKNNQNDYFSNL